MHASGPAASLALLQELGILDEEARRQASAELDGGRLDRPLALWLVEHGYLDGAAQGRLLQLAQARTVSLDAARQASLEGLCEALLEGQTLAQPPPDGAGGLRPGQQIGNYEILEPLGAGGMGAVFRARSTLLDRELALKVILAGQLATPEQVTRFRREARACSLLHHPGIVAIHDFGQADGYHYFTMDLVEGQNLEQYAGAGLPEEESVRILAALADGVAYAHLNGVLHRDLKPANVLLAENGQPRLTDFGLAKQAGGDETQLTRSGAAIGTPAYMSPEQAAGRGDAVDERSDVYGLGAILYRMLAGRPPFEGSSPLEVMHRVVNRDPAPPSRWRLGLDRELEAICLKAIARDPDQRYQTGRALAEDLTALQEGRETQARPLSWAGRLRKGYARHRLACWLAAGLVALNALYIYGLRKAMIQAEVARHVADDKTEEAQSLSANLQQKLGELERANQALKRTNAELARRDQQAAARTRAQRAAREGDPALAERGFRQALQQAVEQWEILALWGRYHKRHRRYDQAIALLERAARAGRRERAPARLIGLVLLDQYWCHLGRQPLLSAHSSPEVLRLFRELAQLDPDSPVALFARAMQTRETERKLALLGQAIARSDTVFWQAHAQRGMLLADVGQAGKALDDLARAVEAAPDDPWIRVYRGWLWMYQLKAPQAHADFDRAARLPGGRQDSHARLGRGLSATLLSRYDEAEADVLFALRFPLTVGTSVNRLVQYPQIAELGIVMLGGHLQRQPQRGYLWGLRGLCQYYYSLRRQGAERKAGLTRAVADFSRARELTPAAPASLDHYLQLARKQLGG